MPMADTKEDFQPLYNKTIDFEDDGGEDRPPSSVRPARAERTAPEEASPESENEPDAMPEDRPKTKPSKRVKVDGYVVLTRRSATLWATGIVVLLVWVFTLGVMVGRGVIFQSKPFKELQRLTGPPPEVEKPVVEVPEPSASVEPRSDTAAPKLTFYDSLTGKPSGNNPTVLPAPSNKMTVPAVPPPPVKDQAVSRPQNAPAVAAPATTPPPASSAVKTLDEGKSAALPPVRKKGENFTIQVAASSSAEQAEKMVGALRAKGIDAYYYHVELNGRTYFRIRVGRFATREQAQAALDALKNKGMKNIFVSSLTD